MDPQQWLGELYIIGERAGLARNDLDLFVNFFAFRFPDCQDTEYAAEWAERFKLQTAEAHADHKSRVVLVALSLRNTHGQRRK